MSPVIAKVYIRNSDLGPGTELNFEFPTLGKTIDLPLPHHGTITDVRRAADRHLEDFVGCAPRLRADLSAAETALKALHTSGLDLAMKLAGDDIGRLIELEGAFQRAWPIWESMHEAAPGTPLPVVEVHPLGGTFPLEQLPVFNFCPLDEINSDWELSRAAARFLGFSAVVRRVPPIAQIGDSVLRNDPALPVQFLRHRKLKAAGAESDFLSSLNPHVRVDGPWPLDEDEQTMQDRLFAALYDGHRLTGGPNTSMPAQVLHFACHCDTSAPATEDYKLVLTRKGGSAELNITYGKLRGQYIHRRMKERTQLTPRAVIVLNACSSSHINAVSAQSFPTLFLNNGHRAFVGTETDVPDDVAAEYAACLYGQLLEGRTLGEAVVWARRDLLRDYRSPLGALYVMYGNIDLVVEHPRPGVHRASW